jgi:16S rRNA (uracil1498-N3)-methyltransferase
MVVKDGTVAIPDRDLARQIARVLRLPKGAAVELFDGTGRAVAARFTDVSKEVACFELVGESARDDALTVARRVDLYPSLIKNDHLSLVVEKATELGASRVVPTVAARSVKRDANVARLSRIAREAAEQCGRTSVPEVAEALALGEALVAARASGAKIVALDQNVAVTLAEAIAGADHVALFVGPEGGWDERDLDALAAGGAVRAALGGFVLRAETAAIVAVALAAR